MIEPKQIMAIIVAMMMLAVGVFSFFTIWVGMSDIEEFAVSGSECVTVTDPSIAQTVTIPAGATITRVYETLNTGSSQNIDTGNYTQTGTSVSINVTG